MASNESTLNDIGQHLDISATDYRRAQERYQAVGDWLSEGNYTCGAAPEIYLQGSFRLGTVVRPFRGDADGDFDIDQVCEITIPNSTSSAKDLKGDIGNRIVENKTYEKMLDPEGKRCWTIEYASDDGRPGFHIDVLPAFLAHSGTQFQIDITDKVSMAYSWSISNPKGYYYWFKSKNALSEDVVVSQRRQLFEFNRDLYENFDDVPVQLVRSPLQRAIQIMKRHRDVYFANRENRPISIIITTIAANIYTSGTILETILRFAQYAIERHRDTLRDGFLASDRVLDYENNEWSIPNPVMRNDDPNEFENFADKWNEDANLPAAFFAWIYQLERDAKGFESSGVSDDLFLRTKKFGEGDRYSSILRRRAETLIEEESHSTPNLLDIIHLAIDERVDWDFVEKAALQEFRQAGDTSFKNIAKVNFYQVTRHRGRKLSKEAEADIRSILDEKKDSPAFVLCCSLLLGTATAEMLRDSLSSQEGFTDELRWPILRLSDPAMLVPPASS